MITVPHADVRDVADMLAREDDKHPLSVTHEEQLRYERFALVALEWALAHYQDDSLLEGF